MNAPGITHAQGQPELLVEAPHTPAPNKAQTSTPRWLVALLLIILPLLTASLAYAAAYSTTTIILAALTAPFIVPAVAVFSVWGITALLLKFKNYWNGDTDGAISVIEVGKQKATSQQLKSRAEHPNPVYTPAAAGTNPVALKSAAASTSRPSLNPEGGAESRTLVTPK